MPAMNQSGEAMRVVVAGGGIAALEVLAGLRALAGERVAATLLSLSDSFSYRPLSTAVPFTFRDERTSRRVGQRAMEGCIEADEVRLAGELPLELLENPQRRGGVQRSERRGAVELLANVVRREPRLTQPRAAMHEAVRNGVETHLALRGRELLWGPRRGDPTSAPPPPGRRPDAA
jgi:hypothetical protein